MAKGCIRPVMVIAFSSIMDDFVSVDRGVSEQKLSGTINSSNTFVEGDESNIAANRSNTIVNTLFGTISGEKCFDYSNSTELTRYNQYRSQPTFAARTSHTAMDPIARWSILPLHCRTILLDNVGAGIIQNVYLFIYIGLATFAIAYAHSVCWHMTAARQCAVMRREMFRAIMRQSISWFDSQNTRQLANQLIDSVEKVHDGMQKMNLLIENITGFVASFVIALVFGWELGLIVMVLCPFIALGGCLMMRASSRTAAVEIGAYAKAGAVAEETFRNIRTVAALGCEQKQLEKYMNNLSSATTAGVHKGVAVGIGHGFMWAVVFVAYGLAFFCGAWLVRRSIYNGDGRYTVGTVLLVFFGVLVGAMQLGLVMPNLQAAANCRAAAFVVVETVKRRSSLNSSVAADGEPPQQKIRGKITFRDVSFSYPSRPEAVVLDKLSFEIEPGTTVALVGASGCGKSTTVELLERFYDPNSGTILVDDVDLRQWNVSHLRQAIGIVSQEPVLFATSIGLNIQYGGGSTGLNNITQSAIDEACRQANIYDFILNTLPLKFNMHVGQKGSLLSGGEKQRIAIARALVKQPAVLVLDEATSALDAVSERLVQQAIDKVTSDAAGRRTVLIIAHRLSTIRRADKIFVFKDGRVAESGTHDELVAQRRLYYQMVVQATPRAAYSEKCDKNADNGTPETQMRDEKPEITEEPLDAIRSVLAPFDIERISIASNRASISRASDIKAPETRSDLNGKKATLGDGATNDLEASTAKKSSEKSAEKLIISSQLSRLVRMNAPEWWLICLGLLSALVAGAVMPVYAVLLSEMLKVFAEPDLAKQARGALFWSGMFLVLGAVCFLSNIIEFCSLGVAGERLTSRLRQRLFSSVVRQDMEFFDWPQNNVSALTSTLASDASAVQGATGSALALILQSLCTLVVAFAIGFYYSWKVTLILLGTIPFVFLGSYVEQKLKAGEARGSQEALKNALCVVSEAIEHIRTVAMLNLEAHFVRQFEERLEKANKAAIRRSFVTSVALGYSQGIKYFAFALAFWSGWLFIRASWLDDDVKTKFDFSDMLKGLFAIMYGAMNVGQTSSFAQGFGKAKVASAKIFQLIDEMPTIRSPANGLRPSNNLVRGEISFQSVDFAYPTRSTVRQLRGLSIKVNSGQSLALVGHSGCGKSTIVQMLLRFYEPLHGEITLDGRPIKQYDLKWLRQQFGLVGQEPVLFGGTVRENISYGCETPPTYEEIVTAAKDANLHGFIMQLPQQYDTFLGDKGAQLSGGQKQRIAIARALIRKPTILLLDEATSALDTGAEHIVQTALIRAMQGRTSIVVAHRLPTVKNCDTIAVIDKGQVVECGTHKELMQREGLYHKAYTTLSESTE